MRQKTISRTATFAWSPGQHAPLLATGAVAGAFDASFSNASQLEIFDLNLTDKSPESIDISQPAGIVNCNARFNRLAWASPTIDRPYGVIAGGMESGELNLWDANAILSGSEDVLYSRQSNHSGPVRGLHFNPFQQNLLSSASINGEIFIWDLGNLTKPYTPGARSTKLEDITCVSWNNHVQHILATSSSTGYTVVWDLKSKREVLTLSAAAGMGSMNNLGQMGASRRGITAIAWNPDVATQIITATEDDNNPVIQVWDLRYAHAPEKTLSGHTKGILSLSWCQQDSDLLLSAGKDCRSLCWNPRTGEIIGELPPSSSWTFDIAWCPRNPDLLASASFDGQINIESIQSTHENEATTGQTSQGSHDPFAPQQFQTQTTAATISLKQPPKWLRRPVGATFGFGGKLVVFRNKPAPPLNLPPGAPAPVGIPTTIPSVSLVNIVTESELVQRASELEYALETKTLDKFCEGRSHGDFTTTEYWTVLRALFEANPREQLVHHLGFDKQEMVDQVAALTRQLSINANTTEPSPKIEGTPQILNNSSTDMNALFGANNGANQFGEDAFSSYSAPANTDPKPKPSVPFHIYPASDTDIDKKITRCIVAGDFESAVNVCLHDGRLSDALVLAICGGPELLEKTQKAYFERRASSTPYIRLLQSVVTGDLEDVVRNADLADWQEIVVILCTFARPDEFGKLCENLGNRLEQQWISRAQSGEQADQLRCNTVLCYLAAGNLERVVAIWIREHEDEVARNSYNATTTDYERNSNSLQAFIEKVTVFRKAIDYVDVAIAGNPNGDHPEEQDGHHKLAALYDKYAEYAEIMASQGRLTTALEYLNLTPVDYQNKDTLAVMRDRLYHSGVDVSKVPAPEFPFEPLYVLGDNEYQQQQQQFQTGQQAQQNSGQYYDQSYSSNQYQQPQTQQQYQPNQYQPQQLQNNQNIYGGAQNAYGAHAATAATPFGNAGYNATGYQPHQPQQSIVPPPPNPFSAPPQQPEQRTPQPPNPYAPAAPTYGGYAQPPAPPTFGAGYPGQNDNGLQTPFGGQYNQGQQGPPVERTRSAELPASQRKDTGNWNDPPSIPLVNAAKRNAAVVAAQALNKTQFSSPFPGSPSIGNNPSGATPPPAFGQHAQQPALPPPPMAGARPPAGSTYSPVPAASHLPPPPTNVGGAMSPRNANQRAQPSPFQNFGNQGQATNAYGQPPQQQQQQQQQYQQGYQPQQGYGQTSSPGPYGMQQPPIGGAPSGMPQVLQQRPLTPAAPPTPPEPTKHRHPAGDRTHIPAGQKLIFTVLSSELALARQYATPAARRPLDDAEKKLNVLFDMLNNEEVSGPVVDQMLLLAQALQAKNYNSAYQIHLELHSSRTDEVSSWMTGVKRLIVDNAKLM